MKRLILIVSIFLAVPAWGTDSGKTVSKSRITAIIAECRGCDGVDLVNLGRVKTAAIKSVLRIASLGDRDAREALRLMKDIHGITILDYEGCSSADKARISNTLGRALSGREMLMEASDGGEKMRLYGVVDDKTDIVRDFVLYTPSECALICIFGSISMDTLAKIASND